MPHSSGAKRNSTNNPSKKKKHFVNNSKPGSVLPQQQNCPAPSSPHAASPNASLCDPDLVDTVSFAPTHLPQGNVTVPQLTRERFKESLSIGTHMDFTRLSEENRLVWLKFFADMVLHLNRECELLQGQLNEYRERATIDLEHDQKVAFVAKVSPTIKNTMFQIFVHLISPVRLRLRRQGIDVLFSVLGLRKSVPLLLLFLAASSRVFRVLHPNCCT